MKTLLFSILVMLLSATVAAQSNKITFTGSVVDNTIRSANTVTLVTSSSDPLLNYVIKRDNNTSIVLLTITYQ